MKKILKTPILFLIFNRPDTTQLVFEVIKKIKPLRLYVAADGPRDDRSGEIELCRHTRRIIDQVNWNCEVKTLFREKNLGCKVAVSSAINWFFKNEEQGIILEDDCIPDPSFFKFCDELLDRYRDDDRVMMISGCNFYEDKFKIKASYYFSKDIQIWGWASWRRAWNMYDVYMSTFPMFRQQKQIENVFDNKAIRKNWMRIFEKTAKNEIDTWDYQWIYSIWANGGLCIVPTTNLVSNVGFRGDATHTKNRVGVYADKKAGSINNLTHPAFILQNKKASEYNFREKYLFINRIKNAIKRIALSIFKAH